MDLFARVLAALAPLLLCPPSVWGDKCGLPPNVINSKPVLGGQSSFAEGSRVVYKCDPGLVKVPGHAESSLCLPGGQWSTLAPFCNRTCDPPPRFLFAAMQKVYNTLNFFPAGTTVVYDCRPGYDKIMIDGLQNTASCLSNYTWSKPDEFCKKKSCPTPGKIVNGHVNITTNVLFGATIIFSCDKGYKLKGIPSSFCALKGKDVAWTQQLPECEAINCSAPPEIANGVIQEPKASYVYQHSVVYVCAKGFMLIGESSIQCTVKDNKGIWSGPPPECQGNSQISRISSAVQKSSSVETPLTEPKPTPLTPTVANVPVAKPKPTLKKPIAVNVPVAKPKPVPQKPTSENIPGTKPKPTAQNPTSVNVQATKLKQTAQEPTSENAQVIKPKPTAQNPTSENIPGTKPKPTAQKPTSINTQVTKPKPTAQKPTSVNTQVTKPKPTAQKPTSVNAQVTKPKPTAQKLTSVNAHATKPKPTAQKQTSVNIPASEPKPNTQKPLAANPSAVGVQPTSHKPSVVSPPAVGTPPTPQKPSAVNSPTVGTPLTAQKPSAVNLPAVETPLTTQKPSAVNSPTVGTPLTTQKPSAVNSLTVGTPLTTQKPSTVNLPAVKTSPTPQKPSAVNPPTARTPLTPQKPSAVNPPAVGVQPTPQKPSAATSAVTSSRNPPEPSTVSGGAQAGTWNSSTVALATQTTPTAQRRPTVAAPQTQNHPSAVRFTPAHTPGAQGLHTTHRLTSAHLAAHTTAVPQATMLTQSATRTSKGVQRPVSGASTIVWGKSGSPAVKRNCRHCGIYNPYLWKRILFFRCLRNTIKMHYLRGPKKWQVDTHHQHVLWTPARTCYLPKSSQPCSCSKVIWGQLQIIWSVSQVLFRAFCISV